MTKRSAELLTDIFRHGLMPVSDNPEPTKLMLEELPNAEVIVADNVARFLDDKGEFDLARDCPTVVPPFQYTWIEYDLGTVHGPRRVGVLYHTFLLGDDDPVSDAYELIRMAPTAQGIDPVTTFQGIRGRPKWFVLGHVCVNMRGRSRGPIGDWIGVIDESGGVSTCPNGYVMMVYGRGDYGTESAALSIGKATFPALMTLAFMHCKNVTTSENMPTRQQRRELERRSIPVVKFKTLHIDPMRKVLETEGGLSRNGIAKALHICRGHFANYSEEKPLFGKYSGQFWIPAHVRGSSESGKVIKTYDVKAPAA